MIKKITCIECPVGCSLSVDIENCKAVKVSGSKCPKGEVYAVSEVENPMRILTCTVVAKGLRLKMIPVRTDAPIPKPKIHQAMAEIRKVRVTKPISPGEPIIKNLLNLKVNLISTREVE
ncbi:MAG: DUF1667 domain-containing protein [Candidatus Omnitrophica bacterium]|nr:DUF1667 domain-containing protein [Candidatus Omnitrophota bacterium]